MVPNYEAAHYEAYKPSAVYEGESHGYRSVTLDGHIVEGLSNGTIHLLSVGDLRRPTLPPGSYEYRLVHGWNQRTHLRFEFIESLSCRCGVSA